MSAHALIVDDEPDIVTSVGDILEVHGHTYDSAGDMESAKALMAEKTFDYLILDLDIPVAVGRMSRKENGQVLLRWVRDQDHLKETPVIVITGRAQDDLPFAISVMKAGIGAHTDYLQKPLDGNKLDAAIDDALAARQRQVKRTTSSRASGSMPKAVSEPHDTADPPDEGGFPGGQLVYYADHIALRVEMGGKVLEEMVERRGERNMWPLLHLLREEDAVVDTIQRYRMYDMKELAAAKEIGISPNGLSRKVCRLQDSLMALVREKFGLTCQRHDIVMSGSKTGYRLNHKKIQAIDGEVGVAPPEPQTDENAPSHDLNDRQVWVMGQLAAGRSVTRTDVQEHFGVVKKTALDRTITPLVREGLIEANDVVSPPTYRLTSAGENWIKRHLDEG